MLSHRIVVPAVAPASRSKTFDPSMSIPEEIFSLKINEELRFQVNTKGAHVLLVLTSGFAEVFGTELTLEKEYEFSNEAQVSVFTYHGCQLKLSGKPDICYVVQESKYIYDYLDYHLHLEKARDAAAKIQARGPSVMVVGPSRVGKSTLSQILISYTTKKCWKPLYVDLDVDRGHLSIPGTLGALVLERPVDVVKGFDDHPAPLVFNYGHDDPGVNPKLYNGLVTRLAELCHLRQRKHPIVRASGIVIDTCGWNRDMGFEHLTHAAREFKVDVILVLESTEMYRKLVQIMNKPGMVVMVPRNPGVRDSIDLEKLEVHDRSIKQYFYGQNLRLFPYSLKLSWNYLKIFQIKSSPESNLMEIVQVKPGIKLVYHVLAVWFVDSPKVDVVWKNVAGFVCISSMNEQQQTFSILSPQPHLPPNHMLLQSNIQFVDD